LDIVNYAKEQKGKGAGRGGNVLVRHKLAELVLECEVGRLMCYRIAWMEDRGLIPNYEASMVKNFGAELAQRIAAAGMELLGLHGQLASGPRAPLQGRVEHSYMFSRGGTIAGGTSEVNRNIIAMRGLGLPRQ